MEPTDSYTVQAFARLADVSVRTLHHYDRLGLLRPARRPDNGYRRYRRHDLLRLQQIITLKYLGFSLQEISGFLEGRGYDVVRSLQAQKEAIDARITQLQHVSGALWITISQLSSGDSEPDWQQVCEIIRGMRMDDRQAWYSRYYTAEQQAWLAERGRGISPEQLTQWQDDWQELQAAFVAHRGQPADHPEVQALAATWMRSSAPLPRTARI
ncbi:MAG: MerR family transcriptional regulator [Anaerolineae bacterium]